jgi:hypothetical protein
LAAQVAERWSMLGQAFMTMLTGSRLNWLGLKSPAPIRGRARLRLGVGGRAAENGAPHNAEESLGPLLLLRSNPGICTDGSFLNVFTMSCMIGAMSSDFDHQREAQAAMRIAAAASGHDRLKWVRVALAWQDLGRREGEGDDGRASIPLRTARDAGRIGPLSG